MSMVEAVFHAAQYAWRRTIGARMRTAAWKLRKHPFVHATPGGRRFELYPGQTVDRDIFVDGAYELRFLQVMEHYFKTKPGAVMLDVGANIGNHAVYLAPSFQRIICFEPSPEILRRLVRNIELNEYSNVGVHPVGLSNQNAMLPFTHDMDGNLGASHFVAQAGADTISLPVRRGDDYLAGLQLNRVDLVKIDVEHHELEVLQGIARTIEVFRPIIAFEYHGKAHGVQYFEEISSALPGYAFFELAFAPGSASNFEKLLWQVRHKGIPALTRVVAPEAQFYESLLGFPSLVLAEQFAKVISKR